MNDLELPTMSMFSSLTECMVAREKILREKIQSLESKLAMAVEALEIISLPSHDKNKSADTEFHNKKAEDALTSIRSDEGGEEKK